MWKRTVRCSYCYNTGHNIRSCPALKESAKTNPWAADILERNKRVSRQPRSCSYCKEEGHNVRSCSLYKKHALLYEAASIEVMDAYYKVTKEKDFDVGSLVYCMPDRLDCTNPVLAIVKKIDHEKQSLNSTMYLKCLTESWSKIVSYSSLSDCQREAYYAINNYEVYSKEKEKLPKLLPSFVLEPIDGGTISHTMYSNGLKTLTIDHVMSFLEKPKRSRQELVESIERGSRWGEPVVMSYV